MVANDALPALKPLALALANEAHDAPVGGLLPDSRARGRRGHTWGLELPRLERVRAAAHLPAAAAVAAEALVEPDEGVDERDPEEELEAHVGEDAREAVVRANADFVVCEVEGDLDVVAVDGADGRGDGLLEIRVIPTVDDL